MNVTFAKVGQDITVTFKNVSEINNLAFYWVITTSKGVQKLDCTWYVDKVTM